MTDILLTYLLLGGIIFLEASAIGWLVGTLKKAQRENHQLRERLKKWDLQ